MSVRDDVNALLATFKRANIATIAGIKPGKKAPPAILDQGSTICGCCGSYSSAHDGGATSKPQWLAYGGAKIFGFGFGTKEEWEAAVDQELYYKFEPEDTNQKAEAIVISLEDADCKFNLIYWDR